MKFVLLFLLAILPFSFGQDGLCANHPKIDDINNLIEGLSNHLETEDFEAIQSAFQSYRESDGDSVWETQLTGSDLQCTGFTGNSCCNDDFAQHFKTIFKGTMQQQSMNQSPMQKEFLEQFGITLGKCAGRTVVEEFLQLQAVTEFLDGLQTCRQNSAEVSVNFIRRNFCTLCFSGEEMSTNFDENGKLIVSQDSIDAYEEAVLSTFDCYSDINDDLFNAIETYFTDLQDNLDDSQACDRFSQWIQGLIEVGAESIAPTKPSEGDCKNKAKFLGNGGCEQNMDGEGIFEEGQAMGPPQQQNNQKRSLLSVRLLTEEDDSDFIVESNGYVIYKDESDTLEDNSIIEEAYGDQSVDIDTSSIVIEEDENDDDDDDTEEFSTILKYSSLILAVILGFLI